MRTSLIPALILILISLTSIESRGQESASDTTVINFFLDCHDCDFSFIRQELPFVSFVRDAQLADIHILVTDSHTGSGGNKYFLDLIGMNEFTGTDFKYEIVTKQSDTDDDIRKALLKIIKVGILPYYSKTPFINLLNIDIEESGNRNAGQMVIDRWNKWIFNLEAGGSFGKEESQNDYSFDGEAEAEKITEEWKASFRASVETDIENKYKNGEKLTNSQESKEISAGFVKSLTEKWSAGVFGNYSSRTFLNIENRYGVSAGIEYNIFPWKECNRRVFTIRYSTGIEKYDYNEETIYDKMKESLYSESLEMNIEIIQPWGEISAGLEGQHYFHDFSKNSLTLNSDFSVRLNRHFSIFFELRSEIIHDQMYLPKGDASIEDILLERRKLATTYEIGGQLGLRFTFGSIFNNVVNERY